MNEAIAESVDHLGDEQWGDVKNPFADGSPWDRMRESSHVVKAVWSRTGNLLTWQCSCGQGRPLTAE